MAEYEWLVVADDLTGANDTGHQFAAAGYETRVLHAPSNDPPPADVLVVNTDSRTASPEAAAEAVRDTVEGIDAQRTYKKVDSTLRGNVGAEVGALLADGATDLALVAPAFPANGRITVNGTHLVEGEPIDEAESVQERENPPWTARLADVLSDAGAPVAELTLETVQEGKAAIARRLADLRAEGDGAAVVACDATTDEHLGRIAAAALELDAPPVCVGSAGLAKPLAAANDRSGPERSVLGVVGSTNETTLAQLRAVPDAAVVPLDVERALDDPTAAGNALAAAAVAKLRDDGVAVVTSARTPGDVAAAYDYAERNGVSSQAVSERIESALGAALAAIRNEITPDGVFATGGTVATATFDALGISDLKLTGEEVVDGVPVASAAVDSGAEITVVTKAGGFGERDTIVECLRTLGAPGARL